jgi:hypothetical protein
MGASAKSPINARKTRITPPAIHRTGRLIRVIDLGEICISAYFYANEGPGAFRRLFIPNRLLPGGKFQ